MIWLWRCRSADKTVLQEVSCGLGTRKADSMVVRHVCCRSINVRKGYKAASLMQDPCNLVTLFHQGLAET